MFSTFDLRLLLYVIRLAGWLKHCNLSLSLYPLSFEGLSVVLACCLAVAECCSKSSMNYGFTSWLTEGQPCPVCRDTPITVYWVQFTSIANMLLINVVKSG